MANPFSVFIGPDGTEYEVEDARVREALRARQVTLLESEWSRSYPYSQTVAIDGATESMNLKVLAVYIPDDATADQVKTLHKAAGCLMSANNATRGGVATFLAYKRPETDVTLIVKGGW